MIKKEDVARLTKERHKKLIEKVVKKIDHAILDQEGTEVEISLEIYMAVPKSIIPILKEEYENMGWKFEAKDAVNAITITLS